MEQNDKNKKKQQSEEPLSGDPFSAEGKVSYGGTSPEELLTTDGELGSEKELHPKVEQTPGLALNADEALKENDKGKE